MSIYDEYEKRKQAWIKSHLDASAEDIERACAEIAEELGI